MKLTKFTKTTFQLFILTLSFAISNVHAQTALDKYGIVSQQVYVAMLGRAGDRAGLNWLANSLNSIGAPTDIVNLNRAYDTNYQIRALIDSYGSSAEFQKHGGGSTDGFLYFVYRTQFNRDPDFNGNAYWRALIDNGSVTRGRAAVAIMASSYGSTDWFIAKEKVEFAIQIDRELTTDCRINAYNSAIWNGFAVTMLINLRYSSEVRLAVENMVRTYGRC
ncbi:MAG: DUF4214 domain-containing protein [Pseudomonadota bacterium]